MKRIVQCPKCQAKLSVSDIGKPIKQKCPKCNENFVIESADAKAVDAKKEQPADAVPGSVNPEVKAEPKPETSTKPESKPEEKPEVKAEAKEPAAPKPAPKPAAQKPVTSALPETEFPEHHSGVSGLHLVGIIGLLVVVILMQVISARNSAKRFSNLETQLSDVYKALSSQILKTK